MTYSVTNYDGGITASPREHVYVTRVEQIQAILRDRERYPSPVRAKGSFHSLTPCVSTDGTIVDMSRMTRVLSIDHEKMTFTAEAGLEWAVAQKFVTLHGGELLERSEAPGEKELVLFLPLCR